MERLLGPRAWTPAFAGVTVIALPTQILAIDTLPKYPPARGEPVEPPFEIVS